MPGVDVGVQVNIYLYADSLQREENLAVLYITHDLATARHFSDDILVLYKGRVVERGPADDVILNPQHPYTKIPASAAPNPEARGRAVDIDPADVEKAGAAAAYDHNTGAWEDVTT